MLSVFDATLIFCHNQMIIFCQFVNFVWNATSQLDGFMWKSETWWHRPARLAMCICQTWHIPGTYLAKGICQTEGAGGQNGIYCTVMKYKISWRFRPLFCRLIIQLCCKLWYCKVTWITLKGLSFLSQLSEASRVSTIPTVKMWELCNIWLPITGILNSCLNLEDVLHLVNNNRNFAVNQSQRLRSQSRFWWFLLKDHRILFKGADLLQWERWSALWKMSFPLHNAVCGPGPHC